MPRDPATDLLPPVADEFPWQQAGPLHERLHRVARTLGWATAIAALAVANLVLLLVVWMVWKAR